MGITERKTRQKQALRERILDAARRIVVREGFAALSMRKIADAIEYSPAALYLHFASRDEIARALCAQGYAQLLKTFEPLAQVAQPAERLKALGRAYVAFGVAHPQTYRLIFMEDPSYTGAALGGAAGTGEAAGKSKAAGAPAAGLPAAGAPAAGAPAVGPPAASNQAGNPPSDESGDAAMRMMVGALDELRAAGRLPASVDSAVLAEAFWGTLHGIVALNLTCPVFPAAPLDTVVEVALEVWFGVRGDTHAAAPATATAAGPRAARARRAAPKPKAVDA